jgi:thiosulfate/3-mercaptopyruvate sulfurtransferase
LAFAHPQSLVSTEWLAAHLTDPGLKLVDATYKMPGVTPTAAESYASGHIAGGVFFDIDAISDKTSSLPHMLPAPAQFAAQVGTLGIGNQTLVILYDSTGLIGAARAWWMFRVFGHDDVAILNGGLPAWLAQGLEVTTEVPPVTPARFEPHFRSQLVRSRDAMLGNLGTQIEQVLDARSGARFRGEAAEPWPGRRSGRIPGSFNLDHSLLIDPAAKQWRSAAEVRDLVDRANIDTKRPIVTSCGSGITACVLAFALHLIGVDEVAVYDGSWAEWGLPGELPVATG